MEEETNSEFGDHDLVLRAQAGDAGAYDRLVLRYQGIIGKQMSRFSTDPAVVEELTQNVFVSAFFALGGYRPIAPFLHWLRAIANRAGYDFWREAYKNSRFKPLSSIDEAALAERREGASANERWEELSRVMNFLKPDERQVLYMQYLDGMTIEAVAETMGWSKAQTKMRCFRARNKLRAMLKSRKT